LAISADKVREISVKDMRRNKALLYSDAREINNNKAFQSKQTEQYLKLFF